jgi:hypothetical protein
MRIELEYSRAESGRPEGTLRAGDDAEPRQFNGTVDLLRLLEEVSAETNDSEGES